MVTKLTLLAIGFWAALATPAMSQEAFRIKPGDTIIWSDPTGQHRVGFGSTGVGLTSVSELQKIVDFFDSEFGLRLDPSGDDPNYAVSKKKGSVPLLKAKVKADAVGKGVAALVFTSSTQPSMKSVPFQVVERAQADTPREIRISTSGLTWVVDNGAGSVVNATAPSGGGGMGMGMMGMCPCARMMTGSGAAGSAAGMSGMSGMSGMYAAPGSTSMGSGAKTDVLVPGATCCR